MNKLLARAVDLYMVLVRLYNEYKKTVMAAAAAVAVTASVLSDGAVTSEEWVAVVAAWGGVLAVYQARNVVRG